MINVGKNVNKQVTALRAETVTNIVNAVTGYQADNTGVTDCTSALQSAINYASSIRAPLYLPKGTYRTSAPLVIPTVQGFVMYGAGNRNTILDPRHSGNVIEIINGNSHIVRDIKIETKDASFNYLYTGVYVKDSIEISLSNVTVFLCKNGIFFDGGVYTATADNLYVYRFKEKGVYLRNLSNSNKFTNPVIQSDASTTVGSVGVYIDNCAINDFNGGSIYNCETCVYSTGGVRNYFDKIWFELYVTCFQLISGNAFVDSHGATINLISSGAMLFDAHGQSAPYSDLVANPVNEDKSLKALWFFNEGTGSRVLDKSGNKKHITLQTTPTWTTDGTWGTAAYFKNGDGRRVIIPLDTVDWTQPYTFAINYSSVAGTKEIGLYLESDSGNKYFYAYGAPSTVGALLYNNPTLENPSAKANGRYGTKTLENIWIFIYVDPVLKTVEMIDPFGATPVIQLTNAPPVTAPTSAYISGRNHASNTSEGNMSMALFFQRKLSLREVYSIANNKDRPFKQFDKKVQISTTLVSANGSNYKVTVSDAGVLTTTLL